MLKQSRSKEQSLGKLMKIYVSQMMLNLGVSSCQEQGINVLAEYLINIIRKIGAQARKLYELQGRQEANIFHVLITLDNQGVTPTVLLTYFKRQNAVDFKLNRMMTTILEQIYRDKYGQPENDEITNLRQQYQLPLKKLVYEKNQPPKSLESLLTMNIYFKNQFATKQRKEITEKELKKQKKKYLYELEEDNYQKAKELQKKRKDNHVEFEILNPYNVPLKKAQQIKQIDDEEL